MSDKLILIPPKLYQLYFFIYFIFSDWLNSRNIKVVLIFARVAYKAAKVGYYCLSVGLPDLYICLFVHYWNHMWYGQNKYFLSSEFWVLSSEFYYTRHVLCSNTMTQLCSCTICMTHMSGCTTVGTSQFNISQYYLFILTTIYKFFTN